MLKRIINNKKLKYYGGQENCHVEVDERATAAAIKSCEDGWQAEADECDSQINQYNELKSQINSRIKEANSLISEFNYNTENINKAFITHPDTNLAGCVGCMDELISSYNSMVSQCDSEISAWKEKKANALSKKGSCEADTPKVYHTVCD